MKTNFKYLVTLFTFSLCSFLVSAQQNKTFRLNVGVGTATSTSKTHDFYQGPEMVNQIPKGTYVELMLKEEVALCIDFQNELNEKFTIESSAAFEKIISPLIPSGYGRDLGQNRIYNYTVGFRGLFNHVNKSKIQIYSASGLAYTFSHRWYRTDSSTQDYRENINFMSFQVTPFGLRVGNKISAFLELGYGYRGIVNGGIGIKL